MGMFGRNKKNDIVVKMDELPALTEDEQLSLVEINDANVVSRLTSAVPGAAQAIANTATAMQGAQLANAGVYMAKIPTGAQLVNSQEVEGAVRGFFRDAKGIKGQANFLSVEGNMDKIAAMNIANAAMGAASLVVGQYYMKQINEGLATVNAGIAQINDFQDAEYKSKVLTLMTQVKRMSDFKTEIMDNSDIRKEEISRLQILEKECMELLSQANLMVDQLSNGNHSSFDSYSKKVSDITKWQQFQVGLNDILYMISDLNYVLHLGAMSKEQAYAGYDSMFSQTERAINKLKKWHLAHSKKFGIDTDQAIFERKGLDAIIHKPLGLINEHFNYKQMKKHEVIGIRNQMNGQLENRMETLKDPFSEDVKVVIKDGKVFYLTS